MTSQVIKCAKRSNRQGRMGWIGAVTAAALGVAGATTGGCKKDGTAPESQGDPSTVQTPVRSAEISEGRLAAFQALPESADLPDSSPEKVALGRLLYHDTRLSKNHDVSCNSCHQLDKFGVDQEPTSPGHKKQRGNRNSPTVYNAALHMAQFWDGRAGTIEEQAKGPVLNPVEMAHPTEDVVVATLGSMPEYVDAFRRAFPGEEAPVSFDNMAKAIGAFERKLLTPAPWDKFLAGDKDALTEEQKIGFNVYVDSGCTTCHYGSLLGGNTYQRLGSVEPWPNQTDLGRFEFTKNEGDKMMFKVPSLRNIAKTAPYFHDGSIKTLDEAIVKMAKHQLGKELSEQDRKYIIAWFESLTGEPPKELIPAPPLPPSTDSTPKPDPS